MTVLVALVALPAALGMRRYVIVSGSMTGTYDRGSLVFDEVVPTAGLRAGDVITYKPPPNAGSTTSSPTGSPRSGPSRACACSAPRATPMRRRTRGPSSSTGARQARVRWSLPYAGFAFAALGDPKLRIWLLGVPAVLIALGSLAALWRRLGDEAAARAADGRARA